MSDANEEQRILTMRISLEDPKVMAVNDALASVLVPISHTVAVPKIMTAVAWTAVSACKSFGLHPQEFVKNFLLIYQATTEPDIEPVPLNGEAKS